MKNYSRRSFIKQNSMTGLGALLTGPVSLLANDLSQNRTPSIKETGSDNRININGIFEETLEQLGGMSLQSLYDFHLKYLTNTYIPNWNRGIDWKYGGFTNALSPNKEPDFERKGMYFQGRAIWMFSYLYNNITGDKKHLEAAIKGRDFIIKSALNDNFQWNSFVSRDGNTRLTKPLDHYGDIYIIQGLTELYKATKNEKDLNIAMQTAHSVMKRLVSPSYQHVDAHTKALEPGTRRLPCWQHFLGALNPLLKVHRDPAIEMIARYCVRVICDHHWQSEDGVLLETLDDKFRPYSFDAPNWGDFKPRGISGWHSIQASWLVMHEAMRVEHYSTYRKGLEMGISTLEKTYIEGKGIPFGVEGVSLENPGDKLTAKGKTFPWGALDDVLVFCLSALEHNHDSQVISYYNKCFALHNSRPENIVTSGLLHTPRRFFYTMEILQRMINRNGRVSGAFS